MIARPPRTVHATPVDGGRRRVKNGCATSEVRVSRYIRTGIGLASLALTFCAAGCNSAPPPSAEPPKPAETAKPAVVVGTIMHEQLTRVTAMQDAVARGDLEAAAEPARWIVEHQSTDGLPAGTAQIVADLKKSAGVVAEAKDLKNAATATAMVVSYCGTCHAAAKATPAMPEPVKPAGTTTASAHMLEHEWAAQLLYQGLAIPSEERWQKGLNAMKASALAGKDLPKDAKLTREIVALEKRVHDIAANAGKVADIGTKVAVYGDALASCAGCHSLHGQTWGPGLPKTP
jgi:hypothetical protein